MSLDNGGRGKKPHPRATRPVQFRQHSWGASCHWIVAYDRCPDGGLQGLPWVKAPAANWRPRGARYRSVGTVFSVMNHNRNKEVPTEVAANTWDCHAGVN